MSDSQAAPTAQQPLPSWYTPEPTAPPPQPSPPATSSSAPLPDWYTPEAPPAVTTTQPQPQDWGVAKNFLTGLLRAPGAVIGVPQVLEHTKNWAEAKLGNLVTGDNLSGADIDKADPVQMTLPSPSDVDRVVFGAAHVTPYEPTSVGGKIGQAVVTGAGAGLVDPAAIVGDLSRGAPLLRTFLDVAAKAAPNAIKTGVAAGSANAVGQLIPNPAIAAGAAFLAHAGLSGAEQVAKTGGGVLADTTRQVLAPTKQGQIEAGRSLAGVDNSGTGAMAAPSAADLATAGGDVTKATDAIGPGLPDWQAGSMLRSGLQTRTDALKAARSATADTAFDAFRAQQPLPAEQLQPFMRSPSFKKALGSANGAVLDEGGEPLTNYFGFSDDEDLPSYLTGKAIPPDVLHRVGSQLGDAVKSAEPGSAAQRTATMLNSRFNTFLEQQYPASGDFPGYSAIRQGYADASRPLDPMSYGPVEKVLGADRQFGQSRYTFPDERIPDLFLRSNATRADLGQLVDAFGGDKDAATAALQQHLAGVAQSAVQPDGTLDTAAFDKAMQPYQKSLGGVGMYFPQLAQKFANAKAAQSTLGTMQTQRSLADDVTGGALRDQSGAVTGPSFNKWLSANKDAIAQSQHPAAVMRLQSIGHALQTTNPGELADTLKSEWAPTALGMATGGLEGGVLGTLLHKSTQAAFGGLDAKRQAAFSAAIERATMDPDYAARLLQNAGKSAGGGSPARALVRAIAATPIATTTAAVQ
jgi:hypothetical protein